MGEMLGGGNIFRWEKYERIREQIWDIPLGVYCVEEGIRIKDEIQVIMGFEITTLEYNRLRGSIKYVRNKYKAVWEMRGKGKSVSEWLAPIKKGSNKIRNLISGRGSRHYREFTFEKIKPIKSLWEKMDIEQDEGILACGMTVWCTKEVDTEFRQYVFKWYQGMVHGNTVISHFGDVDRKCTFCKIKAEDEMREGTGRELTQAERDGLVVPDENRPHIFWDCPIVNACIQDVYRTFWGVNTDVEKKDFLMGRDLGIMEASVLYMLINMYIKYRIWKYKLARVLPKHNCIIKDVRYWVDMLTQYNKWRIMLPLVRRQVER